MNGEDVIESLVCNYLAGSGHRTIPSLFLANMGTYHGVTDAMTLNDIARRAHDRVLQPAA
jgi:hypothetical protein